MSEWINVKDRLPDKEGEYLVVVKILGALCVIPSWFENDSLGPNWRKVDNDQVIYWMPLPEPPKEDTPVGSCIRSKIDDKDDSE